MTVTEAENRIIKTVDRIWSDKALELFRALVVSNSRITTVSGLRISSQWPHSGSITFKRDADGKKCRLYMTKTKWKAVAK